MPKFRLFLVSSVKQWSKIRWGFTFGFTLCKVLSETATICSLYIHLNLVRDAVLVLLDGSESPREYRSSWYGLQMNGMRVPMTVIEQLVKELDSVEVQERKAHPLKRRTYQNSGPDHFWHYDGHDQFKPYGFPANGCIDSWSRLPISYLWHVPRIYQANSIILFGSSWRVKRLSNWSDHNISTENGTMAGIHVFFRNEPDSHGLWPGIR